MVIAENVGPNVVVASISEGMSKSKIPVQQKAALQIFLRLVTEFGANSLDLKSLFTYLKSEQALANSHVEVKTQAIEVISNLHRQIGPVVRQLVLQSGLNELLKKSVEEALDAAPFDPQLAARYATDNQPVAPSSANSSSPLPSSLPTVSLSDLVEKADLTKEISGILKGLNDVDGKDSWKRRQQSVLDLTALLARKMRIMNNGATSELASVLKDRISESNLNLKAKVIECVGQLAESLGDDINQYPGLLSELLRCVNDSNRNVSDALYSTLTKWVVHDNQPSAQSLNILVSLLPSAFKSVKSRNALLHWLNEYLLLAEPKPLMNLIPSLLDCLVDRVKEVRDGALKAFQIVIPKCGRGAIDDRMRGRKPAEIQTIQSALEPLYQTFQSEVTPPTSTTSASPKADQDSSDKNSRLRSLASRPGARVLGKRPGGGLTATMKRQAVSSIPKPVLLKPRKNEIVANSEISAHGMSETPSEIPTEACIAKEESNQPIAVFDAGTSNQPLIVEEESNQPVITFDVGTSNQPPSFRCESICMQLQGVNEMLLTQRELSQFEGVSLTRHSSSSVHRLIASLAVFVASVTDNCPINQNEKNECICASAEICQIFDNSSCLLVGDGLKVNDGMRKELESMSDCVLQLFTQLFIHIQVFVDNQESLLLLNMLNAVTVLVSDCNTHPYIHSHTLTQFIASLIQALSTPFILTVSSSETPLRTLIHSLLLHIMDKVSLSLLLPSLAALPSEFSQHWVNASENDSILLLLRRILIRVLSRVNTSQFTDTERRQCVEAIRCELPEAMPEVLRREYETYMHVLEPLVSTSFGGVLRSGTQLFSSQLKFLSVCWTKLLPFILKVSCSTNNPFHKDTTDGSTVTGFGVAVIAVLDPSVTGIGTSVAGARTSVETTDTSTVLNLFVGVISTSFS